MLLTKSIVPRVVEFRIGLRGCLSYPLPPSCTDFVHRVLVRVSPISGKGDT